MYEEISENQLMPVNDTAILQMEKAQIDTQISTAKKYPRNLQRSKKNMIAMATLDEETAKSCFFVLPRGGRSIQGESVRLAEIALSCYGNIKAGTRVIDVQDRCENPHVVVQAVTLDLENNVAITIEKRRRITKKKNKSHPDEDDINLAVNACSAIAFRDAVFKVIPKALIKPVYDSAVEMATGGKKPIESRIADALDKFAQMGVFEDRILASLEKDTREELVQGDMVKLIGFFNAIKDGETSIESCFPKVEKRTTREDIEIAGGKFEPSSELEKKPKAKQEASKEEETPAPEKAEESVKEEKKLKPVVDMNKTECKFEIKQHVGKPYYAKVVEECGAAEFPIDQCPVSMLQDIVFACRDEADK